MTVRARRDRTCLALALSMLIAVAARAGEPGDAAAADEPQTLQLEELTVSADPLREEGYRLERASSATKTDTPIFAVPASVQVVPQTVIREQQATALPQVYRNVSGVFEADDYGSQRSDARPVIRGFESRSIYRDGFPLRDAGPIDLQPIERVEIVKGPASMLYGLMEPGGVVNVISKRPQLDRYTRVEQQFGSYDFYRTSADTTGPVDAGGRWLYRANLAYQTSDSFRDFVDGERVVAAPALTWRATDDTAVSLLTSYTWQRKRFDSGVAFDARGEPVAPIGTFLGEPSLPLDEVQDGFLMAEVSHRIADDLRVRSGFFFSDFQLDFQALVPSAPTKVDDTVNLYFYDLDPGRQSYALISEVIWQPRLWGTSHTVLGGLDLQREDFDNDIYVGIIPPVVRRIVDPQYGPLPTFLLDITGTAGVSTDWLGAYVQDQIDVLEGGPLKLLLGGRFDYVAGSGSATNNGRVMRIDDDFKELSGRAGVLYEVTGWLAAYTGYSTAFQPPANGTLTLDGSPLDPETGEQIEVGLKARMLDDGLLATVTLFDLTKDDVVIADPRNPQFSLNGGRLRSRGVEVDVIGELLPGWTVIANYAFLDTEVLESDVLPEGEAFRNVPPNSGGVWTWYALPARGWMDGIAGGLGVQAVEARLGDDFGSFTLPGYATLDLALAYRRLVFGRYEVATQLNVSNVLDTEHYTVSNFTSAVAPGAPVSLLGSLAVSF